MRNALLFVCLLLISDSLYAQEHFRAGKLRLDITASLSYSAENLNWSIAGNTAGTNPNVLSELKWAEQVGLSSSIAVRKSISENCFVGSSFTVTTIKRGYVTDTDFGSDHRRDTTFSVTLNTDSGKGYLVEFLSGRRFHVGRKWIVELSAGYLSNRQYFYINGQDQESGLRSTYLTRWRGALIQMGSLIALAKNLSVLANLSYNQLKYDARADWNTRDDFQHPVSFRHKANGYGVRANLELSYHLAKGLSAAAKLQAFHLETGRGFDHLYYANGKVGNTQLNEAVNYGYSAGLSLKKNF